MSNHSPHKLIGELVSYALRKKLIENTDAPYTVGALMSALGMSDYITTTVEKERPIDEILSDVCDYAYDKGIIQSNTVVYRDLFDTEIMGKLIDRPSNIIKRFYDLYSVSPTDATDYFYALACDSNYIRRDRIARDVSWQVGSAYGNIDITINLSKPEKDPVAIAAAKNLPSSGYPKCALCRENEGYPGSLSKAARQNIRLMPMELAGEKCFMQYSPYVYYNEHCIVLSGKHTPMSINKATLERLLSFITLFPHYFIGSNADLPIVGGSILSHDHMQGGRYCFAMERAPIEIPVSFPGYSDVKAGIIHWPLSVIRLYSENKDSIVSLGNNILSAWRSYSDPEVGIYAETQGEPHNTVTPIARRRGTGYELDLTLRNNITTEEHPLGVFHPHKEHHNIKKENIGLIEVMGLAVLPSRLKEEIELMKDAILSGIPFASQPDIAKHAEWFNSFKDNYCFTKDNVEEILRGEIGKTFIKVLEDAGVFKVNNVGRTAFLRFLSTLGAIRADG